MNCWECEDNPGEKNHVEYTDGITGTVQLCERCLDQFEKAEFVAEIQPFSTERGEAGSV